MKNMTAPSLGNVETFLPLGKGEAVSFREKWGSTPFREGEKAIPLEKDETAIPLEKMEQPSV